MYVHPITCKSHYLFIEVGFPQGDLTEYQTRLREIHVRTAAQLNATLNREFRLPSTGGVFYVNLSMAPRELAQMQDKSEYVRRTAESFSRWEVIDLDLVFDPAVCVPSNGGDSLVNKSGGAPSRLLLLGGAGMGKTTVIHKVASGWGSMELWENRFGAVYHFECRRFRKLISTKKQLSLCDLVTEMHGPPIDNKDRDATLSQGDGVLFLFDGMDELAGWSDIGDDEPIIRDIHTPAEIPTLIYNILHCHLVPHSKVMFTSRPNESVDPDDFDRVIVALGFNHKSIEECVQWLCLGDEDKVMRIMDHLKHKTQLYVYCIVPITCVMLCMVLLDDMPQANNNTDQLDRATQLYIRVTMVMLKRRMTKVPKNRYAILSQQKQTLTRFAALAGDGMFQPDLKIVFDQTDLINHDISDEDLKCGLLEVTTEYCASSDMDNEQISVASFLHLSLQEFLAAVHLVINWSTSAIRHLCEKNEGRKYDMVQLHVAGLTGDALGHKFISTIDPGTTAEMLTSRGEEFIEYLIENYNKHTEKRTGAALKVQVMISIAIKNQDY